MIDQSRRQVRVKTSVSYDRLHFRAMHMSEEMSVPYEMHLELYSDDPEIPFDDVLGHNLTVGLNREGGERFFNGFVTQFGFAGSHGRRYIYRAVASPWLWFLTQTENCRIFHNQSALDIIKDIFDVHGFNQYRDDTVDACPVREYCVQFRESDFNFVSRLMEQEGISYYFEHENGRHRLVLVDDVSALEPELGYESIKLFARDMYSQKRREGIFSWNSRRQVRPTRMTMNDFDFVKPSTDLTKESKISRNHNLSGLEVYRYPGGYSEPADGASYAKKRVEALQTAHDEISAEANSRGLRSGTIFSLEDHPVSANNRTYIVRAVQHSIQGDDSESGKEDGEIYTATMTAIPDTAPMRPVLRSRKPLITGPQTAIVKNDTDGEEIEPDEYGRVKVAFHWERYGESSCWVRVSQAWAGNTWGAMSIPRNGQEVIVEFIDGDPDRPLITGRVYNGDSMPPYDPKAHRTVTTFKTDSSKGGGGFNELRFDDKKGNENVFVHAQLDLDIRTQNVRREAVGVDVHTEIGKKEFRKIGEEQHEEVGHSIFLEAGEDINRKAGMNVLEAAGMDYVLNAGKAMHLKAGVTGVIEAKSGLTIKCGGSFIALTPSGIYISGPTVSVNSGGSPLAGPSTKPKLPKAPDPAKMSEPGIAMKPPRARSLEPTKAEIDSHPVASAMLAAAQSGAPFCKLCMR